MKKLTKQQTIDGLNKSVADLQAELENMRKLYRDYYSQYNQSQAECKKLEYRVSVLEGSERRLIDENNRLRLDLAEEDARAEAFEFVLRLQYDAPVVNPVEHKADHRAMSAEEVHLYNSGLTGRG